MRTGTPGTPIVITGSPGTPIVITATPDFQATIAAMNQMLTGMAVAATGTAVNGTPDYRGTVTALAAAPGSATGDPSSSSSSANGTTTPGGSAGGGGGGTGSGDTSGGTPTAAAPGWNGLLGSDCSAYVRVIAYVDMNEDSIMALRNEGDINERHRFNT